MYIICQSELHIMKHIESTTGRQRFCLVTPDMQHFVDTRPLLQPIMKIPVFYPLLGELSFSSSPKTPLFLPPGIGGEVKILSRNADIRLYASTLGRILRPSRRHLLLSPIFDSNALLNSVRNWIKRVSYSWLRIREMRSSSIS